MKLFGVNPIQLEGYGFEAGYGYSNHVNLVIEKRKYTPVLVTRIINWGTKEAFLKIPSSFWKLTEKDIFCRIVEKQKYLLFSALTKDIECPAWICGYTAIELGQSPWGHYYSNLELGKVKKYKSIVADASWKYKAKGSADLAFDVWLTKNKKGIPQKNNVELMVWLDHKNLKPLGDRKDDFGNFQLYFSPLERSRKFVPHQPCGSIVYYLPKSKGKIKFDLKLLITNSAKYFEIENIEDYWLRTIWFGIEYAKNSKVEARISDLKLNLIQA